MTANNHPNSSTDKALSVIIVGAGLGGLSAGLALRKQGHKVTILEKSRFATEAGAAIHIPPNCTILLQWLGLNPEDFNANLLNHIYRYDKDGNINFHNELTQDKRKGWIAEWYLAHRVDFHNALKTAALSADGDNDPIALHTACKVVDIDVVAGTVYLEDGQEFRGDVLLGADGVHSITRPKICPGTKPTPAEKSCFRWLVPASRLAAAGETAEVVKQPGALVEWHGEDRRLIGYPCSNNKVFNLCAFLPIALAAQADAEADAEADGDTDASDRGARHRPSPSPSPGGIEKKEKDTPLRRAFSGFSPGVRALASEATALDGTGPPRSWTLMHMDPLRTWVGGRTALLGDAAHPFQPYMGQGAAMAIEDGVSIAAMLPFGTGPDEVPSRLALYEQARKARVARVQEYTRRSGQDDEKERISSAEMMSFVQETIEHDEREHSTRLLREALGDGS